jgi:hypothetical protein
MWKAQLVGKSRKQDGLQVDVRFFDDAKKESTEFVQEYTTNQSAGVPKWIQQQVFRRLAVLTAFDTALASLALGDIAGLPADAPTAEQNARTAYSNKLETYQRMLRGIEYGIFTGNETQITSTKQWLLDNWQNSFIDLL